MSKKIMLKLSLTLCFSAFLLININATASDNGSNEAQRASISLNDEQNTSEMFNGLDGSDKVLELSDGGYYLSGQATVTSIDNEVIAEFDSETDPNAVTINEAKERSIH